MLNICSLGIALPSEYGLAAIEGTVRIEDYCKLGFLKKYSFKSFGIQTVIFRKDVHHTFIT